MNTIYIEKIPDMTWGQRTNIPALERLLGNNKIILTPGKLEKMPEEYINDRKHSTIQSDSEREDHLYLTSEGKDVIAHG